MNCNANQLHNAIIKLEKIDIKIDKILSYAHLLVAQHNNIEKKLDGYDPLLFYLQSKNFPKAKNDHELVIHYQLQDLLN